jgi:site-specific DNA recombinase
MTMTKTEGLRFAPLIRVSTEGQEKKGESLRTQRGQIEQYVKSLKGTVATWDYCGQEHATPDYERAKLDKLLEDSGKGKFDAVIVCDASRWSRDNLKSKKGLKILRDNDIRFFVATQEFDLYDPGQNLFLGMSAEIGEYQAKEQNRKSILNRIERAKRGIPSAGKLPYGRIYNRETNTWSIDEEKRKKIQWVAERYLDGDSIPVLAETLGVNVASLWKTLNHRSGDKWALRFQAKDLNVDETVVIGIPRLLDDATIEAIHRRADAQRTYTHGEIKHRYLLSRMIFCAKCGGVLFGQTNHSGTRHYRHTRHKKSTDCHLEKFVPADLIENAVLIHLVQTFGDVERIQRAVAQATPNPAQTDKLIGEQTDLQRELKKVEHQKDRVVAKIMDGLISDEDIKSQMGKLKDREAHIRNRLETIETELVNMPDPARVKRLSKLGKAVFADATRNSPQMIFEKSYEWKRNLIEHAFSGKDTQGRRLGVYVSETVDPNQPWRFEVHGLLEHTIRGLPLDDDYLTEVFKLDPQYQDIEAELGEIKTSFSWR